MHDDVYQVLTTLANRFQRRVLKIVTIQGHVGHLGHLAKSIWTRFLSPISGRIYIKCVLGRPSCFWEDKSNCWWTMDDGLIWQRLENDVYLWYTCIFMSSCTHYVYYFFYLSLQSLLSNTPLKHFLIQKYKEHLYKRSNVNLSSSFEQTRCLSAQCCLPSVSDIGHSVPKKNVFIVFT